MTKNAIRFIGQVTQGKLHLDKRDYFQNCLTRYEGKKIVVILDRYSARRSLKQNAYYWAIVTGLAEHLGYFPEECHEALKWKFLRKYDESDLPTVKSTSYMNKLDMASYIDTIRKWAIIEYGMDIPTPDEFKILHPENYDLDV